MRQFYSAESTLNPIWLFQIRERLMHDDSDGEAQFTWRTIDVFSSREEAQALALAESYNWGKLNKDCRVWATAIKNDSALALAMSMCRPDLQSQWDDAHPIAHAIDEEEEAVIAAMETYGGSFVKQLAYLFRLADAENYAKLKLAFRSYWFQYTGWPKNQGSFTIKRLDPKEQP